MHLGPVRVRRSKYSLLLNRSKTKMQHSVCVNVCMCWGREQGVC